MLKSILFRQSHTFRKSINQTTRYLFQMSSSKLTRSQINIPYKLGGLDISQLPSEQVYKTNDLYMKDRFGENIMNNFSEVYRSIVNAIAQKDKEYLQRVLQKNLVNSLLFSDKLQLLDSNAQIIARVGKIVMISYGEHDRVQLSKKKIISMKESDDGQYITMRAEGERDFKDIPFLFCFNVYFKSKMRLTQEVTSQSPDNNKQQIHKIQFQIQSRLGVMEGLKKSISIFFKNIFNMNKMVEEFENLVLGKNQQNFNWKIGDIDNVLNGNFTAPTQPKKQ